MIKEEKRLSVIVPACNTEKQLARCLDSILRQTYKNIEVIVVNDGSEDGTEKIIRQYLARDDRVHYIKHETNRGLFQARLSGFEASHGDYIAFVDSDDYISADYYRPMIRQAAEWTADIVANDTVRVCDNGEKYELPMHMRALGSSFLPGTEARNRFYGQGGYCYSWHTIWNKIYSRALWEQALPYYKQQQKHLVMTEDLAFSSVLFYFAGGFIHISEGEYFYCENAAASTNTDGITFSKFKKNLSDLLTSFDFVSDFLVKVKAEESVRNGFLLFRKHYYSMYRKTLDELPLSKAEYSQCMTMLGRLWEGKINEKPGEYSVPIDAFRSKWYDRLETIKEQIISKDNSVISFDVFDTLLIRPLWKPEDVFEIMEKEVRLPSGLPLCKFKELRQLAETTARSAHSGDGVEDVSLDEIYERLFLVACYPAEDCRYLKEYETDLEIRLLSPRKSGLCLYELAKYTGKDIVLVSDMYLPVQVVTEALNKAGISGYKKIFVSSGTKKLKSTGSMYAYVSDFLRTQPDRILHIGDSWENDIVKAEACGFQTAFLPKSVDRFCNQIPGMPTNRCATLSCVVGNHLTTWDALYSSLGFRTMQALIAHKVFDNPYRSWNENTDLNADPYIAGYYAGGMYLSAISIWLTKICRKYHSKNICFLTRDGFLPLKAFEKLRNYLGADDIAVSYVPCSRSALFPLMVESREELFALPVSWRSHTPESLAELLQFCSEKSPEEIREKLKEENFTWDRFFSSEEEYCRFIRVFAGKCFSSGKLSCEQELVKRYYQDSISPGSIVFDLGYSGRIVRALDKCVKDVVYAYALHDNDGIFSNVVKENISIEFMTHFTSSYSHLIREYFLSELTNSCVKIAVSGNGKPEAVMRKEEIPYSQEFPWRSFTEGSLDFVSDYLQAFSGFRYKMYDDEILMTLPLEGMIHVVSNEDRHMLDGAFSDDYVFGNAQRIAMSQFWINQTDRNITGGRTDVVSGAADIYNLIWGRSKTAKFLLCLLCDWTPMKNAVKEKLHPHPRTEKTVKKTYYSLRRIYRRIKK